MHATGLPNNVALNLCFFRKIKSSKEYSWWNQKDVCGWRRRQLYSKVVLSPASIGDNTFLALGALDQKVVTLCKSHFGNCFAADYNVHCKHATHVTHGREDRRQWFKVGNRKLERHSRPLIHARLWLFDCAADKAIAWRRVGSESC